MLAPRMPESRRLHLPTLITALAVVAVFAVHLQSWVFLCDDAYISFRYAANFAASGELAYNLEPLERVEGYTNPLWVWLLAIGELAGIGSPQLAPVLTATASALALLLTAGCLREAQRCLGGAEPRAGEVFLPAAWLALTPEFVVWGSGGLEGSCALALGLAAWLNALRGRWSWSAGFAAAAVLTRPDAAVWVGIGLLAVLLAMRRIASPQLPDRRALSRAVAIGALPVIGLFVFRYAYYGALWPNTWAVKSSGAELRMDFGVAYLRAWATGSGALLLLAWLAFARRAQLPFLLAGLGNLAFAWWVGGDFMAYSRFLLPATTAFAIVGAGALIELRARVERRWPAARAAAFLALATGATLAVLQAARLPGRLEVDRASAWLDKRWEGVDGMHKFAAVRVAAGKHMRDRFASDTRVSVGAAGALPYASGLFVFDAYGLVDPAVAQIGGAKIQGRPRPGHQFHAPMRYLKSRDPDLLCHVGWVGRGRPPASLARRRAGAGWSWACVETGPIVDPRAGELPSQNYCCPARPGFVDDAAKGGGGR